MSDLFPAALDLVLDALRSKQNAGAELRAPAPALAALRGGALVGAHPSTPTGSGTVSGSVVVASKAPASVELPVEARSEAQRPSVKPPGAASRKTESAVPVFPQLPDVGLDGSAADRLEALRSRVLPCTLCPQLAETRKHVVFGEGDSSAELMLVGDAPGVEEDSAGRPFVGEAGALLDKMLLAMGLSRKEVYLSSVLKCHPYSSVEAEASRPPAPEEIGRCAPYLAAQIAIVKPKVIVALGAGAMRALFGSTQPVGKLRSHWHELHGIPVMPTFNPAYLIRNSANTEKRKVWEDLLRVLERLGRTITAKQQGYFLAKK